ncbi:MAG: hypothetical protein F4Y11_11785 [Chloroflexi bacterium]|nr:hypothetical protein [Chloroflexota bacterium]
MPIRKPWIQPSEDSIRAIPAVVGVYEIADDDVNSLFIRTAGRRQPLGGRSRVGGHFGGDDPNAVLRERAAQFRWEANQQYTTKRLEMLMQFQRDEGVEWPPAHTAGDWRDTPQLGRLRRSESIQRLSG